jgi:ABC-type nitrate/sulfonate/bicarbonate transport system permease component
MAGEREPHCARLLSGAFANMGRAGAIGDDGLAVAAARRNDALRMAQGWLLASLLGIGFGSFIGSSPVARDYLEPTLEFLRPFPASAIIPAAILLLGLSNQMVVGALWPVLLSTIHGFSTVEPRLREVAQALQLTPMQYLFKIAIPAALPDIFTGLRVSLAIALILAVVVEMQAGQPGLGQNILLARMFRSPELYAGIVVLGLFGFVTNRLLLATESYLLGWRGAAGK